MGLPGVGLLPTIFTCKPTRPAVAELVFDTDFTSRILLQTAMSDVHGHRACRDRLCQPSVCRSISRQHASTVSTAIRFRRSMRNGVSQRLAANSSPFGLIPLQRENQWEAHSHLRVHVVISAYQGERRIATQHSVIGPVRLCDLFAGYLTNWLERPRL